VRQIVYQCAPGLFGRMAALLAVITPFARAELEHIGRKMACNEYFGTSLKALFSDTCGFSNLFTQIVQFGTTDGAMTHHFYTVDLGRMHREGTLHTNAGRNLANGEGLAIAGAMAADDITLINLDALLVALDDTVMYLYMITDTKVGKILFDLLLLKRTDDIHGGRILYCSSY